MGCPLDPFLIGEVLHPSARQDHQIMNNINPNRTQALIKRWSLKEPLNIFPKKLPTNNEQPARHASAPRKLRSIFPLSLFNIQSTYIKSTGKNNAVAGTMFLFKISSTMIPPTLGERKRGIDYLQYMDHIGKIKFTQ
jgi:hypothetical protein